MAPSKSKSPKKAPSREKKVMNIADELPILDLLKKGETVAAIARKFKVNESTIRSIRGNEDKIRSSSSNLGQHAKFVKIVRQNNVEKMEEMLIIWFILDLIHKFQFPRQLLGIKLLQYIII